MSPAPPSPVTVAVILPALNEEQSLPRVLRDLREVSRTGLGAAPGGRPILLRSTIVVDNGSTDATAAAAREGGATVVSEPRRGYGAACLAGIGSLTAEPPDLVAFLDADHSDDPRKLRSLLAPLAAGDADFVLGSRLAGAIEPGALLPQARYGNRLAVLLIRWLHGHRFTDLGPFRALTWEALSCLRMGDQGFGWTAEMQVKAVRARLRIVEVPVPYRRRVGTSKITGTLSGTVKAGSKILWTILRYRLVPPRFTRVRGWSSGR